MLNIDINESELYNKHPQVLDMLLFDNTTKKILFGLLIPIKDVDINSMISSIHLISQVKLL